MLGEPSVRVGTIGPGDPKPLSHSSCLTDKPDVGTVIFMINFFRAVLLAWRQLNTKQQQLTGEPTTFDLAKLLAYDGKNLDEQWFGDTCLRADICTPNARFAWEASQQAKKAGDESFAMGALFMLRLVGAQAATKMNLAKLMKG